MSPFVYVTVILLIHSKSTYQTQNISFGDQMNTDRRKFIQSLISTMQIRLFGSVISAATVQAYQEPLHQKYFEDTIYRKFVQTFEAHVAPKLTLNHGDTCDPAYPQNYKNAENDSVSDISLQYWVSDHIPDKTTGQAKVGASVTYCDFRRGLVCNPGTQTCDCPADATYIGDEINPNAVVPTDKKYCFLNAHARCHLLDMKNTEYTKDFLVDRLPYLIFNPDRPLSCRMGTHCRFKPPYINIPRCWCTDDHPQTDCENAKLFWKLEFESSSSPTDTVEIRDLLQTIQDYTVGFSKTSTVTVLGGRPPTGGVLSMPMTTDLERLRTTLLSVDKVVNAVNVKELVELRTLLEPSVTSVDQEYCWDNFNPEDECYPGAIKNFMHRNASTGTLWEVTKECNCFPKEKSKFVIEGNHQGHLKIRYGSPCLVGVEDYGASCESGYACHRWGDKASLEGVCYCPDGYGYRGKCTNTPPNSLVNLVHPTTVAVRGKDLEDIQIRLAEADEDGNYNNATDDPCPLNRETEWEDLYNFFVGIKEQPTLTDAVTSGPSESTLEGKIRLLEELQSQQDKLCGRKDGLRCVRDYSAGWITKGRCEQGPDSIKFDRSGLVQEMRKKVTNLENYKEMAKQLFDTVEIEKERYCILTPASGRSTTLYTDVDENGKCLEVDNNVSVCIEDYSSPDVFTAVYEVNDTITGSVVNPEVKVKNGEVPLTGGANEVATLTGCEDGLVPVKTMCLPLKDVDPSGGSPVIYKNCEEYELQQKKDILAKSIMAASTLTSGSDCNASAEKFVDKGIASFDHPDLYQLVGHLKHALSLTSTFCDRKKLLVCYKDKCECRMDTSSRHTPDGLRSEYCYVTQGPCNQDVTHLVPLFAEEKVEVLGHYGDILRMDDLDGEGCLKNLCLNVGNKECLDDQRFAVFKRIQNQNNKIGGTPSGPQSPSTGSGGAGGEETVKFNYTGRRYVSSDGALMSKLINLWSFLIVIAFLI